MRNFYILILFFSSFLFGQEKSKKLGFFTTVEANLGFDLGAIIKESQVTNEYEKRNLDPGKFNYGFAAQVGYQPLNWLALGTGLRYSYVDPNFHVVYWSLQPYIIVSNSKDEEKYYISPTFGTQINHTASRNAKFFGIGVGAFEPVKNKFANKFQVNVEVQDFDGNGTVFVGFTYGITLFSNKNL